MYTQTLLPGVAEGAEKAGRPLSSLDMMIEMKVSFDDNLARAREDTGHWAALALSPEEKMSVEDPVEMERLADALDAQRSASRWIVSADVDDHVAAIQQHVDMGFRHLVFHAPGTDQERFLRTHSQEIMPRLRSTSVSG